MDLNRIEQLLRASRPAPDAAARRRMAARVLGPRSRRRPRLALPRPLITAAIGAGALALTLVALSLAGAGPLGSPGGTAPEARSGCHTVTIVRRERRPTLIRGRDGEPRISYEVRRVRRQVERCR